MISGDSRMNRPERSVLLDPSRRLRRLLCDATLATLARWLRAAGHDTAVAQAGEADGELLALCRAERRILVTRDHALADAAAGKVRAVLLDGDDQDAQALALFQQLGLDWASAPFTRCLIDNMPLRPAEAPDIARMPEEARGLPGPFRVCPACSRVFWPGTQVQQMRETLKRWNDLAAARKPG
jgi:hypothetical protein